MVITEWQVITGSKTKQPWFIVLRDRMPMAFAGLWEQWRSPEGEIVESCTIIVTEANALMQTIHDRMPVILPADDWDAWLSPVTRDTEKLQSLLKPYKVEDMTTWPVSTQVNSPKLDSDGCIAKLNASNLEK